MKAMSEFLPEVMNISADGGVHETFDNAVARWAVLHQRLRDSQRVYTRHLKAKLAEKEQELAKQTRPLRTLIWPRPSRFGTAK